MNENDCRITEELTFNQLSKLDSFVMLFNKISHSLYVDLYIKKIPLKELCPAYQSKYFISRRHFYSVHKFLEGKVSSILALNKNYILETKHKIKEIQKDLSKQIKTFNFYEKKYKLNNNKLSLIETNLKKKLFTKIQYNKQRLSTLIVKLKTFENIRDTKNVHLCFGSNKLFRQQFNIGINKNPYKNHEQWYKEWFYNRNKEFTLIGSKDEKSGNSNAQIINIKDNVFNLRININHKANKFTDKYVNINFRINHEVNTLKQIIVNNNGKNKELWQALTYKLIKQPNKSHNKNKYVVAISFEKHLIKKTYTDRKIGSIGVDINQDHLAISNLDNKGNLLNIDTFNYDLNGTINQNNNFISLVVKDLMNIAVKLNKPIVIEQLDFSAKKKNLKAGINKSKNKQLSSFAYSKIIELIKARAEDNFIEIIEVNSAYTSMIGSIKYSKRNKISIHHSAAVCIGRKGLFGNSYKEKRISNRNKQIKSLNLPERNNLNSLVYWKELKKIIIKQQLHEKNTSTSLRSNSVMNASEEALL